MIFIVRYLCGLLCVGWASLSLIYEVKVKMSFQNGYNDYQQRTQLLHMFQHLGVFKFEMTQDEKWFGGYYFWPYC